MSATIYFCTENYIKSNTPITANVNWQEILPLVKYNSDAWLRKILGSYFYTDLLTKYNQQTLSADETYLVSLTQPSLAWRVAADSALELSFQIKNKGVMTQSGDFSSNTELKAIQFMYSKYVAKSEFTENMMIEWLIENKLLFSKFTDVLNKDSALYNRLCCSNTPNGFNSPIFLI